MTEVTVRKAAAIILNTKGDLLICKSIGADIWITVGGKYKVDLEGNLIETPEECLKREISEELGSDVHVVGDIEFLLTSPREKAATSKPSEIGIQKFVIVDAYLVKIEGEPSASDEVEELRWLSKKDFEEGELNLGSVIKDYVVPALIQKNLFGV